MLEGYNCSCFAYGATGAGKTYTMVGTHENPGIMILTLKELFSVINSLEESKIFKISMSYLEIYNEKIRDLLVANSESLNLREGSDGTVHIFGLTYHEPQSAENLLKLLYEGNLRRTQNCTHANAKSSRSHAILQIEVEQRNRNAGVINEIKRSKFSLIDLAGSERACKSENRGQLLLEGANINRSLLALCNCINILVRTSKNGEHVPYRDSKLTRILKDSLNGNCKTVMISTISTLTRDYEDTYNTLHYANKAKRIRTKNHVNNLNVETHMCDYQKLISQLNATIDALRTKLAAYQAKDSETTRSAFLSVQRQLKDCWDAQSTLHKCFCNTIYSLSFKDTSSINLELYRLECQQETLLRHKAQLLQPMKTFGSAINSQNCYQILLQFKNRILDLTLLVERYEARFKCLANSSSLSQSIANHLQPQISQAIDALLKSSLHDISTSGEHTQDNLSFPL